MKIKQDILALNTPQSLPQVGDLLLADPFLSDPHFKRSAILMLNSADTTQMGIVLNNCTDFTLDQAIDGVECPTPIPIYCGGPVGQDMLFVIHHLGNVIPESSLVAENTYINGDMRIILEYINSGAPIDGMIRFFIGYSGWDVNQLKGELAQNSWAVLKSSSEIHRMLLNGDGNDYWLSMVDHLGPQYHPWKMCPENPDMN